jgi:hypothetical protein
VDGLYPQIQSAFAQMHENIQESHFQKAESTFIVASFGHNFQDFDQPPSTPRCCARKAAKHFSLIN